jgi:hypothetical protein
MTKSIFREVELYENERYNPLSGGWSRHGLLLSDRSPFSSQSGESGFASIEEADKELLSAGWDWTEGDEGWKVDPMTADEGWTYAVDFSGDPTSYSPSKGMVHFVRRRRLVRLQTFAPHLLLGSVAWTCDYVDTEMISSLEKQLLAAIVGCSLHKHPRQFSEAKVNPLKNHLMASLNLTGSPGEGSLGMDVVQSTLESFASSGSSLWSAASAVLHNASDAAENESKRYALFDSTYFRADEREALANALIHKHDKTFAYHCKYKNCSAVVDAATTTCWFAPVHCPNDGCGVVISKKWTANHDTKCGYKLIECTRSCGEKTRRKSLSTHLERTCQLRPVACPFACLGCKFTGELVFKDLSGHLESSTQSHLLLSLDHIQSQQETIARLTHKVTTVETAMSHCATQIAALTVGATAVVTQLEASEKKYLKALHDEVGRVDAKATKRLQNIEHQVSTEMTGVKKSVRELGEREAARSAAEAKGARR